METEAAGNPEDELISLIARQIEDDERILDGLGTGTLSVGDLERWRQNRLESDRRFLQATGRMIAEMRHQGFDRQMKSSQVRRDARQGARSQSVGGRRSAAKRARRRGAPQVAAPAQRASGERRFGVSLADLGLPCSLRVEGGYDEVFAAAARHARRDHHLHGSEESIREAIRGALVELQDGREAPETALGGLRSEELVSDEAANMTRGSGLASF